MLWLLVAFLVVVPRCVVPFRAGIGFFSQDGCALDHLLKLSGLDHSFLLPFYCFLWQRALSKHLPAHDSKVTSLGSCCCFIFVCAWFEGDLLWFLLLLYFLLPSVILFKDRRWLLASQCANTLLQGFSLLIFNKGKDVRSSSCQQRLNLPREWAKWLLPAVCLLKLTSLTQSSLLTPAYLLQATVFASNFYSSKSSHPMRCGLFPAALLMQLIAGWANNERNCQRQ